LHHEIICPFSPAKISEIAAQCGGNCTIADDSRRIYRFENGVCTLITFENVAQRREDLTQERAARNCRKLDQPEGTAS
jgi:hypothetical protein